MGEPLDAGPKGGQPSTFIIEPSSPHTHSVVLLHGLGSNGQKFGSELIQSGVCSNGKTLPDTLPGTRFIFPTSKRRRSSAFSRAKLTQWFDIASLDDPSYRNHTQTRGLEESYSEILDIINREAEEVFPENIILGGLSQGCAMGLMCLLSIAFPIGGFIGMSGWLPFRNDIDGLLTGEDDPFGSDTAEEEVPDPALKILGYGRDLLSIDDPKPLSRNDSALSTPVFLGHGDADEKIRPSLGREAYQAMKAIGFRVDWKSYEGQGHWYKIPNEIDDIVDFIRTGIGWPI